MNKLKHRLIQAAFVFSTAVCVGFIAMFLSRYFIPKSVGLAGGAMVLMYGIGGFLFGLVGALIVVGRMTEALLNRLTIFFGVCSIALIGWIFYQVAQSNRASQQHIQEMRKFNETHKPTSPAISIESKDLKMGRGLVAPPLQPGTIKFYNSSSNSDPIEQIKFVPDEHYQVTLEPPKEFLSPLHLKLDYQVCYLRMLSESKNRYQVVVNEKEDRALWVDKNDVRFYSWPDFLLSVFAVEPSDWENNPLREEPMRHSNPLTTSKDEFTLMPKKIKKEWLQVGLYDSNMKEVSRAWLRWRSESDLLITYSLFS